MNSRKPLNQRGDTIVEVLICVAILGFALASAYTLTTRNQNSSQKTQERAVAVGIANEQLERLREHVASNGITGLENKFCFNLNSSAITNQITSPRIPDPVIATDNATKYESNCIRNNSRYNVSIWKPGNSSSSPAQSVGAKVGIDNVNTFVVTVRWDTAGGGGIDEIKMYYNLYEDTP